MKPVKNVPKKEKTNSKKAPNSKTKNPTKEQTTTLPKAKLKELLKNKADPLPKADKAYKAYKQIKKQVTETRKKQDEYNKILTESRPKLNQSIINDYKEDAENISNKIARIALKTASVSTAVNYAQDMLHRDVNATGINVPQGEISALAIKLSRLNVIRILAKKLGTKPDELARIINNVIDRDFPSAREKQPNTQFNSASKAEPITPQKRINNDRPSIFKRKFK